MTSDLTVAHPITHALCVSVSTLAQIHTNPCTIPTHWDDSFIDVLRVIKLLEGPWRLLGMCVGVRDEGNESLTALYPLRDDSLEPIATCSMHSRRGGFPV